MDFVGNSFTGRLNIVLYPPPEEVMLRYAFTPTANGPRVRISWTRNSFNENNDIEFPRAIEENNSVERRYQQNKNHYCEVYPVSPNINDARKDIVCYPKSKKVCTKKYDFRSKFSGTPAINFENNTTGQSSIQSNANTKDRIIEQLKKYVINPKSLRNFGFPTKCEKNRNRTYIFKSVPGQSGTTASHEKKCARCQQKFIATRSGQYLTEENCRFHSGKLSRGFKYGKPTKKYTCCKGDKYSTGCFVQDRHVWSGIAVGLNGPFYDYVETRPKYSAFKNKDITPLVLVLDCEMCYTAIGLECAEVSIVNLQGELIYRTLVRPKLKIEDYNTQYSGLTEDHFSYENSANIKTLEEVQSELLKLISADTILIGHGLENDLRVLKMIHKTIIDTSILYEHDSGFPFKHSLRNLANQYLKRDIQSSDEGHNSLEDCRATLDLVKSKARKEINARNQFCNRFSL